MIFLMTYSKPTKISVLAIFAVTALMSGPILVEAIEAFACSTSSHCYSTMRNTSYNNYGARADFEIKSIDEYGNCPTNHHFVVMPLWIIFNDLTFVEVGVGEGRMDGQCKTVETFYTFDDDASDWDLHGTASTSTTYTMKITHDSGTDWDLYKDSTLLRTITANYGVGKGGIGAEITHDDAIIADQRRDEIDRQYIDGGAWASWSSSDSQDYSNDNPPYKDICNNYDDAVFGDSGLTSC